MARILIVDDSWFQRMNIRNCLAALPHEILEAGDGETALSIVQEEEPDVIILDLVMCNLDGFAVLESLRAQNITTPVIVFTADIQDTTRRRCLDLGVERVLHKPLTPDIDLPAIVQNLLDSQT